MSPLPATHAALLLPPPALSGCVMACIARSTVGVPLAPGQRVNRFPASPLCGITWLLEGEGFSLPWGARSWTDAAPVPRVCFNGPHAGPSMTVNTGPVRAFMVLLLPDAVQALTGCEPAAWRDRLVPAHEVVPADWHGWMAAVAQAGDDEQRLAQVAAFLGPRWAAVRPEPPSALRTYQDWAQALARRAAVSGVGRSVRQVERRIKTWAGLPLRDLRGLARAEATFLRAMAAERDGALEWAAVADAGGYADQSHFCREAKRVTGFTPAELRARLAMDESVWVYRLWGA